MVITNQAVRTALTRKVVTKNIVVITNTMVVKKGTGPVVTMEVSWGAIKTTNAKAIKQISMKKRTILFQPTRLGIGRI